jgi:hypothetical protein
LIGAPLAMLVDAVTYLWSAAGLATIPPRSVAAPPAVAPSVWRDLRAGMRAVWGDPIVRRLAMAEMVSLGALGFFLGLYMVYVLRDLALDEATAGVIIGFGGVGALVGALLAPRLSTRSPRATLVALTALAQLANLLIPAAGGGPATIIAMLVAHQLIGDGARMTSDVLGVSLRQRRFAPDVLGRANGAFHALMTAALLAGTLASAGLAELIGTRAALWLGLSFGLFAPWPLLRLPDTADDSVRS